MSNFYLALVSKMLHSEFWKAANARRKLCWRLLIYEHLKSWSMTDIHSPHLARLYNTFSDIFCLGNSRAFKYLDHIAWEVRKHLVLIRLLNMSSVAFLLAKTCLECTIEGFVSPPSYQNLIEQDPVISTPRYRIAFTLPSTVTKLVNFRLKRYSFHRHADWIHLMPCLDD